MITFGQVKKEKEEDIAVIDELADIHDLIVYNDDFNTFDHVIETLVKYCKHSPEQAEQCSLIIHYKGKCTVKRGHITHLAPVCDAICRQGISAEVE